MSEATETPILAPEKPKFNGFWQLPGGANGLQGTPAAVAKAIDDDQTIPEHGKIALKSAIAALLEGSENNFIIVHAIATRQTRGTEQHDVVTMDIRASQKLL